MDYFAIKNLCRSFISFRFSVFDRSSNIANVSKDDIRERMAVATHEAWSVPGTGKQPLAPKNSKSMLTREMLDGQIDVSDANAQMIKEFSEKHNDGKPMK